MFLLFSHLVGFNQPIDNFYFTGFYKRELQPTAFIFFGFFQYVKELHYICVVQLYIANIQTCLYMQNNYTCFLV